LIKLSKAADPWSSTLAVFYDSKNEFFVWGMVDQTVHFNTMLVRETEFGGYKPPGTFQVTASGTADLSIYHGFDFVARLQQDQLLTRQSDVFWSGPIHDRLSDGIAACFAAVRRTVAKSEMEEMPDPEDWLYWIVDAWTRTLCRLLIRGLAHLSTGTNEAASPFVVSKGEHHGRWHDTTFLEGGIPW
jgi:hypothetical protein